MYWQFLLKKHNNFQMCQIVKLNPIPRGGGHYGPDDHERPRCFRRVRATTTKIHDFVSVYVWMVPWKSFLGFVFKIFEKRKNFFLTILTSKGPPFGKKIENFKIFFFLQKIILSLFQFVLYIRVVQTFKISKLIWDLANYHSLGQKHSRNAKILKIGQYLDMPISDQCFATIAPMCATYAL